MVARLYAILDTDLQAARSLSMTSVASGLRAAGVKLVQYRSKNSGARQMLREAAIVRELFPTSRGHPSSSSTIVPTLPCSPALMECMSVRATYPQKTPAV